MNLLNQSPDHDFNEPLGLLTDCHRRIEKFLSVLIRVATERAGSALEPEAVNAIHTAKRYFAQAAPRHTADEEESLFPRMREEPTVDGDSRLAIERLHADHGRADVLHAKVDELLGAWLRDGVLPQAPAAELVSLLGELESLYREHIRVEETIIFPLAGRVLSPDQLEKVGAEMRARRGHPPR